MRRISRTLETMACSLDRLLGFVVADPEMPGDAMHHDPLRRIGAGLPLGSQFLDSLAEPIGLSGRRNTKERPTWHTRHMAFRIDYYKEGFLAGSSPHPGPQHETERFAKDGMIRRRADFYRIIDVDSNAEVASGHRDG